MFLASATDTFGLNHIIALAISILFIIGLSILFIKKCKFDTVCKVMLGIGIVSETIKVFSYICMNEDVLGGYLPKTDLPFHLCSIQIIFFIILVLSKNDKLKKLLLTFMIPTCMIGGLAALALPTSSARSVILITIQYFGFHGAITAFSIYLLAQKDIIFTVKDYLKGLVFFAAIAMCAIYINSILYGLKIGESAEGPVYLNELYAVNFMYVVAPPVEGLPFLNKDHGWLVYFIHYASLCVFIFTLFYIKPIINAIKSRRANSSK